MGKPIKTLNYILQAIPCSISVVSIGESFGSIFNNTIPPMLVRYGIRNFSLIINVSFLIFYFRWRLKESILFLPKLS